MHVDLVWFHRFPLLYAVWKHKLPDVIHLHWQHTYFTAQGWPKAIIRTFLFFCQWFLLRLSGVRFVWTVHNIVNHEDNQVRWELWGCRTLARIVDGVIVHCETARALVMGAYGIPSERISVIPHGNYVDWYPPAVDKNEARRALGMPTEGCLLLFIGAIRAYKGLDLFLKAFSAIKDETLNLILAGKPYSPAIKDAILAQARPDPRIRTHLEFIPIDQLVLYLSACDLVVLPYKDFLTSGTAILSASYRRSLFLPRRSCLGEFPEEAVIFFDQLEPEGLQKALETALSAPLERMGAAAYDYIKAFPWSLVAAKTHWVYQSALGEDKRNQQRSG
jgi:glycosyltransferase involved in cell wall biosynthesis